MPMCFMGTALSDIFELRDMAISNGPDYHSPSATFSCRVHRMGTVRFRFMDGFDRKLGLKVRMFARISRLADHYFPAGPNMGSLSKETASLPHRIPVSRETVKS